MMTRTFPRIVRVVLVPATLYVTAAVTQAEVVFDNSAQLAVQVPVGSPVLGQTAATLEDFTVGDNNNRVLIVSVAGEEVDSVASVKFNDVGLTKAVDTTTTVADGFEDHVSIWYLLNPDVGTFDIEITGVNDPNEPDNQAWEAGAASFYNVLQQAPVTAIGTTDTDTTSASLTIAGTAGGLIYESISTNGDNDTNNDGTPDTGVGVQSLTATDGQTLVYNRNADVAGGFTSAAAYELPGTTGDQTQTWTLGDASEHAFAAVSFQMIPEPVSLALVAVGSLLMLTRRRLRA